MLTAINMTKKTQLGNQIIECTSFSKRLKGLLGHHELLEGEGMWIKPCRSIHTFFMKFSIDVVFLSSTNEVLKTYSALKPFRISPSISKAYSVLELPAFTLEKTQTRTGDQLHIGSDL